MKDIRFNKEKNELLKKTRGISFEDAVDLIRNDRVLAIVDNPNRKFPNQKLAILEIKSYIYIVAYVETKEEIFLKTIFPSRKYKKNTKKIDPFASQNTYERELMESIDKGEWLPMPKKEQEKEKKELKAAAEAYFQKKKKEKRITIRVTKKDLSKIQIKALESGLSYQTLINVLLHQYAEGKVNLTL